MAQFAPGAWRAISLLHDAFLRDEDLTSDLDAVLGASAGPTGVAGAKRQLRWQRVPFRLGSHKPNGESLAELGRCVIRLDRLLMHLVAIAQVREWSPPYPNVAEAIAQAVNVRAGQRRPVGEFAIDQAHLRRLAMAASDLLDRLADDEGADE